MAIQAAEGARAPVFRPRAAGYSYCVTFVGKASVRGAYARSRDIAAVF